MEETRRITNDYDENTVYIIENIFFLKFVFPRQAINERDYFYYCSCK